MICGCIAGAIGGAVGGAFNAVSWGYNMPGIATMPAYFKAGHMTQFIGFLISIAIAFVLGIVFTCLTKFENTDTTAAESQPAEKIEENKDSAASNDFEIACPVKGTVVPVSEVKDEVFASKEMGDGVGIIPQDGNVYAPFDGTIEALFPTGHAIGLAANDVSLLIHIGIDTVELNGEGFSPKVKQGDCVKKGDLLVSFDQTLLREKGYDPTVICIVTEMEEQAHLDVCAHCEKNAMEQMMVVRNSQEE